MEKNESNITDVTQNEEQLDNCDEQSQQNEKTFSQEEVSQLIKERIARERKKSDERIKDAVQEAEKLAKMNRDQKNQYELEKLIKENEELKAEKALSQMKSETRSMLKEAGLEKFDDQIVNLLVDSDAGETKKNVEAFTGLLNEMVQANVESVLRQKSPVNSQRTGLNKNEILAIKDDIERQKAIASNLNLFT